MQFEVKSFVIYCSGVEDKQFHAAHRTPKKFFKMFFCQISKITHLFVSAFVED